MNALNEVNKVISSVSYYTHRHNPEEEEWLTAERMAVSLVQVNICGKEVFLAKFHPLEQCPLSHFRSGSSRTTSCPLC